AMFDEHSLIVTYADWRGEPRGHAKRGTDFSQRGHCIDCELCVRVCPTGIDIRNGQQLACIGCGLCVDACNSIMEKIGLPGDLIAYDSLADQAALARKEKPPALRLIRPRTIIYSTLLILAGAAMLLSLALRSHLDVTVQADRAPLFVQLANGDIQNGYTMKISNKFRDPVQYDIHVSGIDGLDFKVVGREGEPIIVKGDSVGTFRLLLRAPREALSRKSTPIEITVQAANKEESSHDAIFSAPIQ
ncbi:MAG: FixG Ig-like domain-containing protein, partial [Dongiaceae bacterium]